MPNVLHRLTRPGQRHQLRLGVVAVPGVADDPDEIVEIRERDEIAFELLRFDLRLPEQKARAAQDDLAPMLDVAGHRVLQRQKLGLAVIDREHVDAEGRLERGVLVEIVDQDLRIAVALQLDDHAGVFVRLIAHVADAGEDFLVHQFGDALDQLGAVHVKRNLGDDDLLAPALSPPRSPTRAAHPHRSAAGLKV